MFDKADGRIHISFKRGVSNFIWGYGLPKITAYCCIGHNEIELDLPSPDIVNSLSDWVRVVQIDLIAVEAMVGNHLLPLVCQLDWSLSWRNVEL